jgi:hypothetical protein
MSGVGAGGGWGILRCISGADQRGVWGPRTRDRPVRGGPLLSEGVNTSGGLIVHPRQPRLTCVDRGHLYEETYSPRGRLQVLSTHRITSTTPHFLSRLCLFLFHTQRHMHRTYTHINLPTTFSQIITTIIVLILIKRKHHCNNNNIIIVVIQSYKTTSP